jgi:LacI family transcriptional regulator
MPVTQRQIADRLGLSPQAVNFALGKRRDQVSDATRRRVEQAARDLGYRANAAAKAVSTGRFNAIGLVMSLHSSQSTLYSQTLRGIHEALEPRGIHLSVTFVPDEKLTSDEAMPKLLGQSMVDGLLLNYTHDIPPRLAELIDRHDIPSVWLNAKRPHDCVHFDDHGAAVDATRRLIDAGHRDVLFLDTTASSERSGEVHYSHADRQAGYREVMRAARLEPMVVQTTGWWGRRGIAELCRLLDSAVRPSAVLCYSGAEAVLVELACERLGLDPGPDLSLICFDYHRGPGRPFTRYTLAEQALGHAAAELMLERLDAADRQPCRSVPMDFYPGETFLPVSTD